MARAPRRTTPAPGMIADVRVIGADQLVEALQQLTKASEFKSAARAALRRGATLIAREQRKRAPKRTGNLRKAIKVATKANWGRKSRVMREAAERSGSFQMFIGIDASVDRGRPAKTDTIQRGKNKGKARRSKRVNSVTARAGVHEFGSPTVKASGFMRGGYQAMKDPAVTAIGAAMKPAIERVAARSARRRMLRAQRMLTP